MSLSTQNDINILKNYIMFVLPRATSTISRTSTLRITSSSTVTGQGQTRRTSSRIETRIEESLVKLHLIPSYSVESKNVTCDLKDRKCIAYHEGMPTLQGKELESFFKILNKNWKLNDLGRLERSFSFENSSQPMAFANKITKLAGQEGQYPDLQVGWGKCGVEIWTHKVNGLTESDFILAAKIDALTQNQASTE